MAGEPGHGPRPSGSAGTLFPGVVRWLMDNSIVLYLAAIAGHRIWVVLNSDVSQLLRGHGH